MDTQARVSGKNTTRKKRQAEKRPVREELGKAMLAYKL